MKDIIIHFMYFYFTKNGIGVSAWQMLTVDYTKSIFIMQIFTSRDMFLNLTSGSIYSSEFSFTKFVILEYEELSHFEA